MGTWRYEPDENPKRKHRWAHPAPGFIVLPTGERVGKCPADVTNAEAEAVLNAGVPWSPPRGWDRPYPKRIWCIHRGWLYRAEPTNPGRSYRAFPEDPDRELALPPVVRRELERRAEVLGMARELRRWLRP